MFYDVYIMIEDKIQILRQAAKVSSEEDVEKVWCVIAGNDKLVNDIVYTAIASKKTVKILFREHISFTEGKINKKWGKYCLVSWVPLEWATVAHFLGKIKLWI